ncbi:MAG TPA: 2-hydroxycarboxylate transporter family protein [Steroidobacteraceae bacterium]|nr:2-hydroxycarboxylate transporter family protein [Steroidobacteraceae bacterium]
MSDHESGTAQSTPFPHPQPAERPTEQKFWPQGWWRLMEYRIGVIPLPVYVISIGVLAYFQLQGKLPTEINVAIAVLAIGGFTCAEIGKRLPLIGRMGGGAIFATFIPSVLVYYKILPASLVSSVTDFTKNTNFLYLFITAIIVGSILGMNRKVLIGGFARIFIPLSVGSIAAGLVGTAVGTLLGLGAKHTLFFLIVPIMAGGVGEGAIPLSVGYAQILGRSQGELFAEVLPVVMLGSLTAILLAGGLNLLGKRYRNLTGEGRLQPGQEELQFSKEDPLPEPHVTDIVAAGLFAISLYLLGLLCNKLFGLPAPVSMLFITVLVKLARAVSPQLQAGAFFVFRFFQVGVTYPLLFAIGVALTPWQTLMAAFVLPKLVTIAATVTTLVATGFIVGKWVKLYPIEAAIVNACHSGQGGTGDVAILTAANRMQLMPFAQVATRIGGAITVTLALFLLARFA